MASTYRQKFRLLKSDGKPYQLRRREITGMAFYYRQKQENGDQTQQFTRIEQLTIDEVDNSFWVSLPPETLEWYMVLQVEPLRTIQTALQTTTFSIDMAVVETFATPCPLESLQGHSPYIDPLNLYWYQYDDELNCYVNTFIKGSGVLDPTVPVDHPIVDYIAEGTMSAVTSNAVANLRREVINHVSESNMRIGNLESKRISVKLNGQTHQEDDNGLVDLGEIKTDTYADDLTMLQQETTLPDGTIVPRGTVVNKDMEVFSLSSPHEFYSQWYNVGGWMYVCYLNGNCQLNVRLSVYNNSYGGTIFVSREGYDYKAVTTSDYLAAHYKILQKGLSAWLVTNGDTHVNKSAHIEVVDGTVQFKHYPSKVDDYTALTTKLRELDVFMTSYTEKDDYLTISTNQFETEFDGLEYHTFNLDLTGELDFQFTDEITEPTVLTFVAMQNDTTVKVQDGVGNWVAVSQQLKQGDMAILTWTSPDAYSWSYTTKKEYEITANKVSVINASNSGSTYLYPSLKALTTWVNANGGKVKSVTINDEKVEPDADGDINIGDVLVPEFELWVAARYDKTSKTTKGEQWSLYDIHDDPLNYSLASETFVRTYVDANNVKTIYLNGQPNVASYGDPTTINLGTLQIRANGIDHQFNGSVCDIGDVTGDKLSMSDDDKHYYFTVNDSQTQTVDKVKYNSSTNTLSIGNNNYIVGGGSSIDGILINDNAYEPEDGWIDLGSIDDCEKWDVVVNLDNLDGFGTTSKPLTVPMKKQQTANLSSAAVDRLRVLIKGNTTSNFAQLYVNIGYEWELTSIANTSVLIVNQSSLASAQLHFKINNIGDKNGDYLVATNLNHNKVWLAMVNGNPQTGYTYAQIYDVGEVDAWLNAYSTAVYNSSTNKLELTRIDGSKTSLTIGGGGGSSLSSVTINGSAHTATNNAIDLGTIKVKTGNDTFSADTDNTVDVGVLSRPTNCRLNTSKSGWIKIDGNNSWFDVTIRLYDAEARILSYQQSGGIRVAYSDSGNRISIFTDKTNSQCFYLYYGGNTSYFLKVNQGNVKITDTEGNTHTIHEYDDVTNNTYNVQLETIDNVTNTLFQLVGHTNPASTNVGTFDWTLPQSTMDYFGKYSMSNSGDVTMTLPLPSMRSNSFDRLCMFENKSSRSPITATIKDNNGNIIKQLTVQPNTTTTTLVEWIGNYSESTSYSGWKCESSHLEDEPNIILGAASQWICNFESANTEVVFERDGRSVTVISDSANTTYITSVSDNNDYLTVFLSDSAPSTCMVSCNGGLTMTVKRGKVSFDEAYGKVITVDTKMHYNSVVFPRAEASVGSYQAMCGNSYYVTGSTSLANASRYNRSGGNLTSINVYLNPPYCTRQKLTTYHTLYTSSSASSWTAFLYGKKSDGSFYQISRQHSYDSAYGKEVVYPTTWDVELQKWVLGEQ